MSIRPSPATAAPISAKILPVLTVAIIALVLSGVSSLRNAGAEQIDLPKVLVLHSYHQGFSWTDSVQKGIDVTFAENEFPVDFSVEYMDTKRHSSDRLFPRLADVYEEKYSRWRPDLILLSDNNALMFLLAYRDRLFPGVPVVFCGINNFDAAMLSGNSAITGVVEDFDLTGTLDVIARLHPDRSRLVAISDGTTTGKINRSRFERVAARFSDRFTIIMLTDLPAAELAKALRQLPADAVIINLSLYRSRDGRIFSPNEADRFIAANTSAPIYTCWDFDLESGVVVGGKVVSGRAQGTSAARMALRILKGEPADAIPVILESPNRYMFDHRQLERFGISKSRLPSGSIVLNEPISFFDRHHTGIAVTAAVSLLIAVLLLGYTIRLRRMKQRLAASELRYRMFYNRTPAMLHSIDREGRLISVSEYWLKVMGYERNEVVGRKSTAFLTDASRKYAEETALPEFFKTGYARDVHYQYVRKNGEILDGLVSAISEKDPQGNVIRSLAVIVDITERKRMETAFQVSERRFKAIYDQMPLYIALWKKADRDFILADVNPATAALSDSEILKWIGTPLKQFYPNTPWIIDAIERCHRRQTIVRHESAYDLRATRKSLYLNFHFAPVPPDTVMAIAEDITDRKETEKALRKSEQRLQQAQRIAHIASYERDIASGTGFWSDEHYRLFGYEPGEVPNSLDLFLRHIHEEDRDRIAELLRSAYENLETYVYECRYFRRDGELRWAQATGEGVLDEETNRRWIQGTFQDITERKLAEAALKKSNALLVTAEHLAGLGAWEWDIADDTWHFSDNWLLLHGVSDNPPKTSAELMTLAHPDDVEDIEAALQQAIESGFYEMEHRIIKRDTGQVRHIRANGTLIRDDAGRPSALRGAAHDLTELKHAQEERLQLERRLQTTQRLESLGIMAGGIAHDFNNLLMVVLGNIELAMEETPRGATARQLLEESETAAKQAVEIVRRMLAFTGKGHRIIEPVNINRLIADMSEFLKSAVTRSIFTRTHLAPDLPEIEADDAQIRQVVTNLVLNAGESYEGGAGDITISTGTGAFDAAYLSETVPEVWVGYDPPFSEEHFVFIEVADNGCGMDEVTCGRIFDPFFTTKFQGRGLGIPSALGIVRAHRGYIRVDSNPGRGTVVRVLLPVLKTPATTEFTRPPAVATPDPADPESGTILVVDDEHQIGAMLSQMLERLGWRSIRASSGMEAVAIFSERSKEIRLVLLDLTMPGMNGVEVLRRLRRMDDTVPVILSSGYSEETLKREYAREGFAGFMQKPYQKSHLARALGEILGTP